eukprot:2072126-Rhodomonas_salina.5
MAVLTVVTIERLSLHHGRCIPRPQSETRGRDECQRCIFTTVFTTGTFDQREPQYKNHVGCKVGDHGQS